MEDNKKKKIINKMQELSEMVDAELDNKQQKREDITYYDDFEFKGSNLAVKSVYIVEISNKNEKKLRINQMKTIQHMKYMIETIKKLQMLMKKVKFVLIRNS